MGRSAKSTNKTSRGKVTPYRIFFDQELKRLKEENPSLSHRDAFKQAGLNWRTSPQNPKVNPAAAATWEKTKTESRSCCYHCSSCYRNKATADKAATSKPASAPKEPKEPKEPKDAGLTSMAAHAVTGAVAAK
ncbi:hypothetical protein DL89DRAFT_291383 [Linderina pennispora]|uniref:YABBY protein C-terminal domain-containing protein n=1 Tax=Linderina pennispora TaxID=61395 RepID=A0A1Y1WF44_9FUNG|nr:uncharacterized protein DL89DRAFT_291383 [Linderina pennispora]ORX72160.1 hypothetical protein DL89DRAFT_291383 [Linderina pennispora]